MASSTSVHSTVASLLAASDLAKGDLEKITWDLPHLGDCAKYGIHAEGEATAVGGDASNPLSIGYTVTLIVGLRAEEKGEKFPPPCTEPRVAKRELEGVQDPLTRSCALAAAEFHVPAHTGAR